MKVSEKSKAIYLILMIIFLVSTGIFWFDYIGLIDMSSLIRKTTGKSEQSVLYADDDEPSLILREEFGKEQEKLDERVADIDRREASLVQLEKELEKEREKIEEMKKGLEIEKKKFEEEKAKYSGYQKNVVDLAQKIGNMPPEDSVAIMVNWEDPLIIDVLRQMDSDALDAGRQSITSYLISLMPREKASRLMYLMTQL